MANEPGKFKVFISSTYEDLKGTYRNAAMKAVNEAGGQPVGMEHFGASEQIPVHDCLTHLDPCDFVVLIVAHRYGWTPPDQANNESRSITWIECAYAREHNKPIFPFFVDPKKKWRDDWKDATQRDEKFNQKNRKKAKQDVDGLANRQEW